MDPAGAFGLILSGDASLIAIVRLSLFVTLSATVFAAVIGMPLGASAALVRFPGREALVVVLNAFMGLPPVVVGLSVFLLLSPDNQPQQHLQAMNIVFSNLQKDTFRRFLRQSATREAIADLLDEADQGK